MGSEVDRECPGDRVGTIPTQPILLIGATTKGGRFTVRFEQEKALVFDSRGFAVLSLDLIRSIQGLAATRAGQQSLGVRSRTLPQGNRRLRRAARLNRVLRRYGYSLLRNAKGIRHDFPNREGIVRLHRLWRWLPERFGSSTGRWHSPSRQCIQQDRIRGIRCAPVVEVFLFLELVQMGRIGDPSRLLQPTPVLLSRQETRTRQPIQINVFLRSVPWRS